MNRRRFLDFMVRVKICGITNLADALAASEAGADALGFNFWRGSRRYIAPAAARRIIERVPEGVACVGVFVNEDTPETLAQMADEAGVAVVQLHGDEDVDFCRALAGREVIKALRVDAQFRPQDIARYETSAVLLDAYCGESRGGTGKTFDWALARASRALVERLYLAGGLTPENVAGAIASVEPYAVDACSGVESTPGKKDAARMRAFVEAVRGATKQDRG